MWLPIKQLCLLLSSSLLLSSADVSCESSSHGLFFAELSISTSTVESLKQKAILVSTGSSEEQVVFNQVEQWLAVRERLQLASKEWDSALKAAEQLEWTTVLKSTQQALAILTTEKREKEKQAHVSIDLAPKLTSIECLKAVALERLHHRDRAFKVYSDVSERHAMTRRSTQRQGYLLSELTNEERFVLERGGQLALSLAMEHEAESFFAQLLWFQGSSVEAHKGIGQSLELQIHLLRERSATIEVESQGHDNLKDKLKEKLKEKEKNWDELAFHEWEGEETERLLDRILSHYLVAIHLGSNDLHVFLCVGTLLAGREEWEAAAKYLGKAVELWPKSPRVHFALGRVLRLRGKILRKYGRSRDSGLGDRLIAQAVTHLQQATWLDDRTARTHFALAELLFEEKRVDEALAVASKAVELDPIHAGTRILLGKLLGAVAKFGDAAEHLKRADQLLCQSHQSKSKERLALLEDLAAFQVRARDTEGSVSTLHQAFQLLHDRSTDIESQQLKKSQGAGVRPEDEEAEWVETLTQRLWILQGNALLLKEDWENAQHAFKQAFHNGDSRVLGDVHVGLADAFRGTGEMLLALDHYIQSLRVGVMDIRVFEASIELFSDHLEQFAPEGELFLSNVSQIDGLQTLKLLQKSVEVWPDDAPLHLALGRLKKKLNPQDQESFVMLFRRAAALNPHCFECHLELGKALFDQRMFQKALEALTSAYKLRKTDLETLFYLGTVLTKVDRLEGGLESFQACIALSRNMTTAKGSGGEKYAVLARVNAAAALLLRDNSDVEQSVRLLLEAVELDPNCIEAHQSLALILAARGQPTMARKHQARAEVLAKHLHQNNKLQQVLQPKTAVDSSSSIQHHGSELSSSETSRSWSQIVSSTLHHLGESIFYPTTNNEAPLEQLDHHPLLVAQVLEQSNKSNRSSVDSAEVSMQLSCAKALSQADRFKQQSRPLLFEEAGSLFRIAGLFAQQGRTDEAVECFEHVVRLHHKAFSPVALFEWGMLLREVHQARAFELLQEAANQLPSSHPRRLHALLWATFLLDPQSCKVSQPECIGQDDNAGQRLHLLSQAVDAFPASFAALHRLGVEFESQRDWKKASEAFLEASLALPCNNSFAAADTFYRYARVSRLGLEQNREGNREQLGAKLEMPVVDEMQMFLEKAHHISSALVQGSATSAKCEFTTFSTEEISGQCPHHQQQVQQQTRSCRDLEDDELPWSPRYATSSKLRAAVQVELGTLLESKGQSQQASDILVQSSQALLNGNSTEDRTFLVRSFCSLGNIFFSDKQVELSLLFYRACSLLAPVAYLESFEKTEVQHAMYSLSIAEEKANLTSSAAKLRAQVVMTDMRGGKRLLQLENKVQDTVEILRKVGEFETAMQVVRTSLMHVADEPEHRNLLMQLVGEKAKMEEAKRYVLAWSEQRDDSLLDLAVSQVAQLSSGAQASVYVAAILMLGQQTYAGGQSRCEDARPLLRLVNSFARTPEQFGHSPELALRLMDLAECVQMNNTVEVLGKGLGYDFETFGTETSAEGLFDAHLLVVPHLFVDDGVLVRNPWGNEAMARLHGEIARANDKAENRISSVLHAWWALLGGAGDADLFFLAGRRCLELALSYGTDMSKRTILLDLAFKHFSHGLDHFSNNRDLPFACGAATSLAYLGEMSRAWTLLHRLPVKDCSCRHFVLAELSAQKEDFASVTSESIAGFTALKPWLRTDENGGNEGNQCTPLVGEPLVRLAQLYESGNKLVGASEVFHVVVEHFSHRVPSWPRWRLFYAHGIILFHLENFTAAVQSLSMGATLNQDNLSLHNNLGAALFKVGQPQQAIKQLEKVLKLCDQRFRAEKRVKQPQANSKDSGAIDREAECKAPARLNLALAYEELGDWMTASLHITSALKSWSAALGISRADLQRHLARLLKARGKVGAAVEVLRDTVKSLQLELQQIKTSGQILSIEGQKNDKSRRHDGDGSAESEHLQFREKHIIRSELGDSLRDLGLGLGEAEQHFESIRVLRRALLMRCMEDFDDVPSSSLVDGQDLLGPTLWDFLDALPMQKVESRLSYPQPLIDLGNAYFRAGDFEHAEKLYRLCVSMFPEQSIGWNNLGVTLFQQGEWSKSYHAFQKALQVNPANADAKLALEHLSSDGPAPWMMQVLPAEPTVAPFQHGTSTLAPRD